MQNTGTIYSSTERTPTVLQEMANIIKYCRNLGKSIDKAGKM